MLNAPSQIANDLKDALPDAFDVAIGIVNASKICFPIWLLIALAVFVRMLWSKPF